MMQGNDYYEKQASLLEEVLARMQVCDATYYRINYDGNCKERCSSVTIPAYILPVDDHQGRVQGIFRVGNKRVAIPIGFVLTDNFARKTFYDIESDYCTPQPRTLKSDTAYLPIRLFQRYELVDTDAEEGWYVCGIDGPRGRNPILFVSENSTDEGYRCIAFESIEQDIQSYPKFSPVPESLIALYNSTCRRAIALSATIDTSNDVLVTGEERFKNLDLNGPTRKARK